MTPEITIVGLNDEELLKFIDNYNHGEDSTFHRGKKHFISNVIEIKIFDNSKKDFAGIEEAYISNLEDNIKKFRMIQVDLMYELKQLGIDVTTKFIKGPCGSLKLDKEQIVLHASKVDTIPTMNKIFISHSSKDTKIVNLFCDLILNNALGIDINQLRCTSIEGTKPKSGSDFKTWIKNNLKEATFILQFISKNYKESEVCLNEMGAAWVLDSKVVPIIVEPDSYDVGFINQTTQQIQLSNKTSILSFISDHNNDLGIKNIHHARLNSKVDEFLESLNSELKIMEIGNAFKGKWENIYDDKKGNKGHVKLVEIRDGKMYENGIHKFNLTGFRINESNNDLFFTKESVDDARILKNKLKIEKSGWHYEGKENESIEICYKRIG